MGSVYGPRADDGTVTTEARRRPRWIRRHVQLLVGLDAAAAALATAAARYVRFGVEPAELVVRDVTIHYTYLAIAIVPTWLAVLAAGRCYDVGPFGTGVRLRRVVRAGANFLAVVAVVYFVLQVENLRREFLGMAVTLAVAFTLVFRALAARSLGARRREGGGRRRALVVGSRSTAATVVRRLALRRGAELSPVGACVPDPGTPLMVNERELPVLGGLDDVLDAVAASGADAVVVTGSLASGRVQRLTWALEGTGIDIFVVPALTHQAVELDVRPVAGLPLVYVNQGHVPPLVATGETIDGAGDGVLSGAPGTAAASPATNGTAPAAPGPEPQRGSPRCQRHAHERRHGQRRHERGRCDQRHPDQRHPDQRRRPNQRRRRQRRHGQRAGPDRRPPPSHTDRRRSTRTPARR